MDQADGPLVEAGLDHPSEEPRSSAQADQAVKGDGVAGLGRRLVVGPRATTQLLQATDWAVLADDHIRVVDGAAAVAVAGQDRRSQRLDRGRTAGGQPDVGQPADHPQVGLAVFELVEGAAGDQLDRTPETVPDAVGQQPIHRQHVGGQEGREPQPAIAVRSDHRLAADGWVSYMRTATTTPEAAVSAAMTQMAATRPARSATRPASRAPTAKPASRHSR